MRPTDLPPALRRRRGRRRNLPALARRRADRRRLPGGEPAVSAGRAARCLSPSMAGSTSRLRREASPPAQESRRRRHSGTPPPLTPNSSLLFHVLSRPRFLLPPTSCGRRALAVPVMGSTSRATSHPGTPPPTPPLCRRLTPSPTPPLTRSRALRVSQDSRLLDQRQHHPARDDTARGAPPHTHWG